MKKINLILTFFIFITQGIAQESNIRPGDPGVEFDLSKVDPTYKSQVETWMKAGSRVGILPISEEKTKYVYTPTDDLTLEEVITNVWNEHQGGQIKIKNGTYHVNYAIHLRSNIQIYAEHRDSVVLLMGADASVSFVKHDGKNTYNAGLHQLTIKGDFGVPNDFDLVDAKPEAKFSGIYFNYGAYDCWLDKVNIINTGYSAINIFSAKHITVRDCYIERAWNKGAGGHGYVQICGNNNLFYANVIKKMRHIAIQGSGTNFNSSCRYNVFYKNKVEQDFNFHNKTGEDNLIEGNTVLIPAGLGGSYHAMMGPWSYVHDDPIPGTVIWGNDCVEMHAKKRTFSDPEIIYEPARHENNDPFNTIEYKPKYNTFYPIIYEEENKIEFANLTNDETITSTDEYPLLLNVWGNYDELFLRVDGELVQKDTIAPFHFKLAGLSKSKHTVQIEALTAEDVKIKSAEVEINTPNGMEGTLKQDNLVTSVKTTLKDYNDIDVKVFPNPFVDVIYVETSMDEEDCYIYDTLGRKIHHQVLSKGRNTITLSDKALTHKIYFLRVDKKSIKLVKGK
ncbi:right-handed parallel beta-helix repeat-containing protein [Puteibacter caeruleilacunae]|nr:right-handed parallel beta-helix repeat-containing protein [Puteibacter caeruleilacunae]